MTSHTHCFPFHIFPHCSEILLGKTSWLGKCRCMSLWVCMGEVRTSQYKLRLNFYAKVPAGILRSGLEFHMFHIFHMLCFIWFICFICFICLIQYVLWCPMVRGVPINKHLAPLEVGKFLKHPWFFQVLISINTRALKIVEMCDISGKQKKGVLLTTWKHCQCWLFLGRTGDGYVSSNL